MSHVPFAEIPEAEWDAVFDTNVKAVWTVCRAMVPHMQDGQGGSIVNTSSGTVFKLKGKGLPRLGRSGNGDLHVRVHVWTPEQLNEEQRRLLQQLRTLEGEPPKRGSGFWSKLKEALGA